MHRFFVWLKRDTWLRAIAIIVVLTPVAVLWAGDGLVSSIYLRNVKANPEYAEHLANPAIDGGKKCLDNSDCISRWCKPEASSGSISAVGSCQSVPMTIGRFEAMSNGEVSVVFNCD
jgi:hypothetical protein